MGDSYGPRQLSFRTPLKLEDFNFELPEELIAQYPSPRRSDSRLLVLEPHSRLQEIPFYELPAILRKGDLLVCNNTKVMCARLLGRKITGGRIEMLVERILDPSTLLVQAKARRPLQSGVQIVIEPDEQVATVVDREGEFFVLKLQAGMRAEELIANSGLVPLPPYIKRAADEQDAVRYQTVYAEHTGSVAAPTAGLHFTQELLGDLTKAGVEIETITLHVGAGTFAPVRTNDVKQHELHGELCEINESTCEKIRVTKLRGGRVIAVGTTTVRTLETAALESGEIGPFAGETKLFIKPGFKFRVVDAMITNFHLPRSTLLMLVCAFGGVSKVLEAYRYAVEHQFRFYSYGDAMFIEAIH